MITLQYFDGKQWTDVSEWQNNAAAWMSLGSDNFNYRTIDQDGKVIQENSQERDIMLLLQAYAQIKASKKQQGSIECPKCKKYIYFTHAKNNHIRMTCETIGCLKAMQ